MIFDLKSFFRRFYEEAKSNDFNELLKENCSLVGDGYSDLLEDSEWM
tara:strand:+ start:203 stop:343 length:141 start_codon:yes stop_codon:yes gene_type:complete